MSIFQNPSFVKALSTIKTIKSQQPSRPSGGMFGQSQPFLQMISHLMANRGQGQNNWMGVLPRLRLTGAFNPSMLTGLSANSSQPEQTTPTISDVKSTLAPFGSPLAMYPGASWMQALLKLKK